jgi:hypothetical protein
MDILPALLEAIPYGVMLSDPIYDSTGAIVNFWLRAFNQQAAQQAPGLGAWYPGVTLWESFPEQDKAGLFSLYVKVFQSGGAFQERYISPTLGQAYQLRVERLDKSILAVSVPLEPSQEEGELNLDHLTPLQHFLQPSGLPHPTTSPWPTRAFENQLARYRRAVYEQYF